MRFPARSGPSGDLGNLGHSTFFHLERRLPVTRGCILIGRHAAPSRVPLKASLDGLTVISRAEHLRRQCSTFAFLGGEFQL
jgi:hypothetical protein